MKMSESEGLIKLTEYLKQTRRQAEAAIDHLNEQIAILNNDNELKSQKLQDAYDQIRNMKLQMEKMKEDTSMKAVFKERDDWKSLVDSIQKDRARLQEENQALSVDLDFARDQISKLVDQVQELVRERDELVARGSTNDQLAINVPSDPPQSISPSASSHDSIILSPIIDRRTGRPIVFQDSNHESLSRRLKDELKRVHDEVCTADMCMP